MKNIAATILALVMLVSMNVVSFAAGTAFSVSLETEKTELKAGDTFTVKVTAKDITASSGIIGLDMLVKYDAEKLIPVEKNGIFPEEWKGLGADFSPDPEKDEKGEYTGNWKTYVLFDGDDVGYGVRENGVFGISLTFKVKDDAAGGPAVIKVETNDLLSGTSDDLESVSGKGGELRVVIESELKLKLKSSSTYLLKSAYVNKVPLGVTVDTLVSNFDNETIEVRNKAGEVVTGSKIVGTGFTVNLLDGGKAVDTAAVVVKGDTDGNGIVDATDYIMIKKHFLNLSQLTAAFNAAADIDGNGSIDSTDYIAIKRHILGVSLIKN